MAQPDADTLSGTMFDRLARRYRAHRHGPIVLPRQCQIVEAQGIDRSLLQRSMCMTGQERLIECQRLSQTALALSDAGRRTWLTARDR